MARLLRSNMNGYASGMRTVVFVPAINLEGATYNISLYNIHGNALRVDGYGLARTA